MRDWQLVCIVNAANSQDCMGRIHVYIARVSMIAVNVIVVHKVGKFQVQILFFFKPKVIIPCKSMHFQVI